MNDPYVAYYLIRFGTLAIVLVCGAAVGGYWFLRRRGQRKQRALEQALADCQSAHFQRLYGDLHRMISHEYNKVLDFILNKSSETLEGLGNEQTALREKQDAIIVKTEELRQHATNILNVFALQPDKLKKELLNIRLLIESVLKELFSYADSKGVTLRTVLVDREPLFLDRDLTILAIRNLVHNAIKYSEAGRVVEIKLTDAEETRSGKMVVISVKDHGRGIPEADKDRLFELNMRGDGLIETGSGLGLYCAKMAAILQGGDVILESSSPNQGSVFKIRIPFVTAGEAVQEAAAQPERRSYPAWRWGAAIAGTLLAAGLLYVLFKPPAQVTIQSSHDGRYLTALGEDSGWVLKQELAVGDCEKFTRFDLGDNKVALRTCNGRYVTAPRLSNPDLAPTEHDPQWQLWQEAGLGDCGVLVALEQPDGKVAFQTCAGMVVTAGDGGWPGEMAWAIVAETDTVKDWEKFTLQPAR